MSYNEQDMMAYKDLLENSSVHRAFRSCLKNTSTYKYTDIIRSLFTPKTSQRNQTTDYGLTYNNNKQMCTGLILLNW